MEEKMQFDFLVEGSIALFTDAFSKTGGNPYSYDIPTPEALRGLAEAIYWKPTFNWHIDAVRVLNKIRKQTRGTKPRLWDGSIAKPNTLAKVTYLSDVAYQVRGHITWNLLQVNLVADRDVEKHTKIMRESIELGGRLDPCLGTSECKAYVSSCVFGEGPGHYDDSGEVNYNLSFHSYEYPNRTGKNEFASRYWRPKMVNGIILFPDTLDCPSRKWIRNEQPVIFADQRVLVGSI